MTTNEFSEFFQDVDTDLFDYTSVQVEQLRLPSVKTRKRHYEAGGFLQTPGLREIARYGGYSTYSPPGIFDDWVHRALKSFDPDTSLSLRGFTRRGEALDGMYKSLFKYARPKTSFNDLNPTQKSAMKIAIAEARAAFKLPYKLQPLDWHEIGQHIRPDTSAGVSFPGKKKGECMHEIYAATRWLAHRMKGDGKSGFDPTSVKFPPCLAGSRGHLSPSDDVKTRLVWIYPAEMVTIEGQYAPQLYQAYMKLPNSPLLLGKSAQRLYTEWLVKLVDGETLIGTDISGFDTGGAVFLDHVAFEIMRDQFEWDTWKGKPVSRRDRQKWKNVWDGMKWYFINTPIIMPDGRMFRKYHGVPSGSWWTQLIDSIKNYILVRYLAECQKVKVRALKVLGDDSAFRTPDVFNEQRAANDAEVLGFTMHPKKCEKTTEPSEFKLLGTRYANGHQVRADDEWMKLALYPENPPPDIGTSMTRLVGLWLGGAMFSKLFCEFFEFFQTCYECPQDGWFSKDQRRWLEIIYGGKAPRGWTTKQSLFWKSIFYVFQ